MRSLALISLFLLAVGCGSRSSESGSPLPDGSATVLQGAELSGNLLDALRSRVPGITISQQPGNCPSIMFRGPRSIRNQGNPSVYLDGTLMVDTCVLQQMNSRDVERVEIYPSGTSSNPRIQRNPFGVIIIYRINE